MRSMDSLFSSCWSPNNRRMQDVKIIKELYHNQGRAAETPYEFHLVDTSELITGLKNFDLVTVACFSFIFVFRLFYLTSLCIRYNITLSFRSFSLC